MGEQRGGDGGGALPQPRTFQGNKTHLSAESDCQEGEEVSLVL